MKFIEKVVKIIAVIILVPTVLLVAFILIAEVSGVDFEKKETETTAFVQEDGGGSVQIGMLTNMQPIVQSGNDMESDNSTKVSEAGITAEKYEQIQSGMTYQEVVALLGEEGKLTAESETQGSKTSMYEWTAKDDWGTAILVFQDNAVINKSQTGLAINAQTVSVTLDQFNRVEEGMTYDKVVELFGGEGEPISESTINEATTAVYLWNGNDGVSNATITFYNNAVLSKAQTGLK